ncbi:hypothetical protein ACM25N_05200 [Roseovarius sp. C7]|uniref:hypothetical protein n=1 Tax=Roseovarius sp. C7 TaxID=3398643 RepID=UPI0039F70070
MPEPLRAYKTTLLIGFVAAAVFLAMALWFDVAGLRGAIRHSEIGWLALLPLWLGNGAVFSGLQAAISAGIDDDDDDEPRGGHRSPRMEQDMIAIRVRADQGRKPGLRR